MVQSLLALVGLLHLCFQVCKHQYRIPLTLNFLRRFSTKFQQKIFNQAGGNRATSLRFYSWLRSSVSKVSLMYGRKCIAGVQVWVPSLNLSFLSFWVCKILMSCLAFLNQVLIENCSYCMVLSLLTPVGLLYLCFQVRNSQHYISMIWEILTITLTSAVLGLTAPL